MHHDVFLQKSADCDFEDVLTLVVAGTGKGTSAAICSGPEQFH